MIFTLATNYGGFKVKDYYRVIREGYDWVLCSANGAPVCFPKAFGRLQCVS